MPYGAHVPAALERPGTLTASPERPVPGRRPVEQ